MELELRALLLLGRFSTTYATLPALFCFSYFSGRVLCFCPGLAWTTILLSKASHVAGIVHMSRHCLAY
jgi:hypothetical protein